SIVLLMDYHHIIWIETALYAMSNFLLTMLLRKPSMHIQQISQILKNRRQVILVFWEYECVIVCYQMYFWLLNLAYKKVQLISSLFIYVLNAGNKYAKKTSRPLKRLLNKEDLILCVT
ncbi:hypothetical protein ACJX0J_012180, partial [Zea mays]